MDPRFDASTDTIDEYLARHEGKQLLRFLTCGSVDDGKSTLIGRLLHDTKGIYEDQLAAHPEAAAGHALGHYLDFGPADRAVELARANLAARPNAEAHTWLALALLHADRPDEAREHVTAALATPWRSGDLLALAAELDVGE